MQRAHKIRLNPTLEQEVYLRKASGTARFAYNYGLRAYKAALDAKTKPEGALALKKVFNAIKGLEFPWVYEVTKCAVDTGFRNLSAALSNFWKSKKGERKGKPMGFPHFKTKRRGCGSFLLDRERFSVDGHMLTIERLATPINMTEALRFAGKIRSA